MKNNFQNEIYSFLKECGLDPGELKTMLISEIKDKRRKKLHELLEKSCDIYEDIIRTSALPEDLQKIFILEARFILKYGGVELMLINHVKKYMEKYKEVQNEDKI
jgi:hypothetical protein